MRRSGRVAAPLLAAAAVGLMAGCRRPEMQRCVDEQNHVVAESFCQANGVAPQAVTGSGGGMSGGMGYFPRYRYYYGGGGGWNLGSGVYGGDYAPLGGHSYTSSSSAAHSESVGGRIGAGSSTSRGGFGGMHGGGEGGGHGGGGE